MNARKGSGMAKSKSRKRVKVDDDTERDLYFLSDDKDLEFVSTGCEVLNCVLGGGVALGRVTNIIGDKSTAKTALATEILANLLLQYPDAHAAYRESESAFDLEYVGALGIPVDRIDFGHEDWPITTVEEWHDDILTYLDELEDAPGAYVIDSLDALSEEGEMTRNIRDASYGGDRPKKIGITLKQLTGKLKKQKSRALILIVSQVRDNIGVKFGDKLKRTGGKALDFYASQFLWLSHRGIITKERNGIKMPVGIKITAKCKKNKIGFPFRQCEFEYRFGFGIDDVKANLEWLKSVKKLKHVDLTEKKITPFLEEMEGFSVSDYEDERTFIAEQTRIAWREVQETFMPKRSKYSG